MGGAFSIELFRCVLRLALLSRVKSLKSFEVLGSLRKKILPLVPFFFIENRCRQNYTMESLNLEVYREF